MICKMLWYVAKHWSEVLPVGRGLWQASDQSGSGSGFSCGLWETWTRLWPDRTRSHAASGARLTPLLPPEFAPTHTHTSGWKTCDSSHTQTDLKKSLSFLLFTHFTHFFYLLILQIFDLGRVVAISLAMVEHFEARHANCIHHRATVREELHISHLQHAAMIGKPNESDTARRYPSHALFRVPHGRTLEVKNGQKLSSYPFSSSEMHMPNCLVPVSMALRIISL